MIREDGENGRVGAFSDGVNAYVIARERSDGRMAYTVGRTSQFIPFDVPKILVALNTEENNTNERWGGGNTIGGSPRIAGSRLCPNKVEKIINEMIKKGESK